MFDNFAMATALIFILWIALFVFYLYASGRQSDLEKEIETLDRMLGGQASESNVDDEHNQG